MDPIVSIKDVEKTDLDKVRIWKEDKCSGENPLYWFGVLCCSYYTGFTRLNVTLLGTKMEVFENPSVERRKHSIDPLLDRVVALIHSFVFALIHSFIFD